MKRFLALVCCSGFLLCSGCDIDFTIPDCAFHPGNVNSCGQAHQGLMNNCDGYFGNFPTENFDNIITDYEKTQHVFTNNGNHGK